MNQADRKEFDVIHQKIDQVQSDIKFIKENMFNPHQGLWAETKLNTQFRTDTKKWRGVVGAGFIGLVFKQIWDLFNT
jgi:hypothetical protein|tara:strand:+ start:223 stop:453 length:231 start_codon:yes stop_codon:yes gene_type:complete